MHIFTPVSYPAHPGVQQVKKKNITILENYQTNPGQYANLNRTVQPNTSIARDLQESICRPYQQECAIKCQQKFNVADSVSLKCGHLIHKACINKIIKNVQEALAHIGNNQQFSTCTLYQSCGLCKQTIKPAHLKRFMNPQEYQKITELISQKELQVIINKLHLSKCPNDSCNFYYKKVSTLKKGYQVLCCPKCLRSFSLVQLKKYNYHKVPQFKDVGPEPSQTQFKHSVPESNQYQLSRPSSAFILPTNNAQNFQQNPRQDYNYQNSNCSRSNIVQPNQSGNYQSIQYYQNQQINQVNLNYLLYFRFRQTSLAKVDALTTNTRLNNKTCIRVNKYLTLSNPHINNISIKIMQQNLDSMFQQQFQQYGQRQ